MSIYVLLLIILCSCNSIAANIYTAPKPTYTLPGGGGCVALGKRVQPPYTNVRITHDNYQAHSETMIAEDPNNLLHLVAGAKFFPTIAHYRFQVGYANSFDGGCTWTDKGVLPGFSAGARTLIQASLLALITRST